jgi:hypothetical protein
LVEHANRLRREARAAFDAGDHERAALLLERAELLAADVGALVDAIEERQADDMMRLAAGTARPRRRRPLFSPRAARIGAALGAGLAMSLALVEC